MDKPLIFHPKPRRLMPQGPQHMQTQTVCPELPCSLEAAGGRRPSFKYMSTLRGFARGLSNYQLLTSLPNALTFSISAGSRSSRRALAPSDFAFSGAS